LRKYSKIKNNFSPAKTHVGNAFGGGIIYFKNFNIVFDREKIHQSRNMKCVLVKFEKTFVKIGYFHVKPLKIFFE
jgi:hypothetical protein